MATTRVPFSNVTQVNKHVSGVEKGEKNEKHEKSEKPVPPTIQEITQVKNQFEESIESMDHQTLIQSLKLHKMILKHCFEENDILRERVATVEAQFSNLQDEIEIRDKVILELSDKLEQEK